MEEDVEMAVEFVRHINAHLKVGEVVVCKICGKSIFEIWGEKGEAVEDYLKVDTYQKFMELLEDVWNTDYGVYRVEDDAIEIHTGGWSENEEVLPQLKDTFYWGLAWQRSDRGGHYYLKVIDFENRS